MIRRLAIWGAALAMSAGAVAWPGPAAQAQGPAQFQTQQPHVQEQPRFRAAEPPAEEEPAVEPHGQAALQESPVGGNWSIDVQRDGPVPGSRLDAGAIETIEKISAYFNKIGSLEGRFIQTDPDKKRTRGRFYVQRPGLLRFDYAPPSLMRIVSDGRFLSVENHDLKTIDKYPLESTPFRMLLQRDVNLLRDAHIVHFAEQDAMVHVTVQDKSADAAGRLMLAFSVDEEEQVELREWIIEDPQGLVTRIQLGELVTGNRMDREFFAAATIGIQLRD